MNATEKRLYRINEIFRSVQGEGFWTGTAAVFVRMSGCNLSCPFCDTDHRAFTLMGAEDIASAAKSLLPEGREGAPLLVLTGGEPALQADEALVQALHGAGFRVHMETNGTLPVPDGIDWITMSPKTGKVALEKANELKLVLTPDADPERWSDFPADWRFLQPCSCRNTDEAVSYILAHPIWRLSLQTHKYLDIK